MRTFGFGLLAAVLLLMFAGGAQGQTYPYTQNFDAFTTGASVAGWTNATGSAFVVVARNAISGTKALGENTPSDGHIAVYTGASTMTDGYILLAHTVIYSGASNNSVVDAMFRMDGAGQNGYLLAISMQTPTVILYKISGGGGTYTPVGSAQNPGTFASGTQVRVKFGFVGTQAQYKIWAAGNAEPGTWTAPSGWTDATYASGYAGLRYNQQASQTNYDSADDISIDTIPTSATAATAYTLFGSLSGFAGAGNTFTLTSNGVLSSAVTVTVSVTSGGATLNGGSSTSVSVVLPVGVNTSATFTAQNASAGTATLHFVNGGGLSNPADATYTTSAAGASFSPDPAVTSALFWSPGTVYFDASRYAHVRLNATYFKATFSGTNIGLTVSLATYLANSISTSSTVGYGYWVVSIDGGAAYDVPVITTNVILASGLTNTTHTIQAWFDLRDETDTYTPKDEQIVQAINLDSGATLSAPTGPVTLKPKRGFVAGDSITKGAQSAFPGSTSLNHPLTNFAAALLSAMNAEGGQAGYSGQGIVSNASAGPTAGNLLPVTFLNLDSSHSRTMTGYDYWFFCEGVNDGSTDITSAIQTLCNTARVAMGASTWIFFCVPFGDTNGAHPAHGSQITAGVAAYKSAHSGDTKIAVLDPTTILTLTRAMTTDGTHPLTPVHQQEGAILAQLAQSAMGGTTTTVSGTKRRVQ